MANLLLLRLLKAFLQSAQVIRRVKPDVVVGFGCYIAFPDVLEIKKKPQKIKWK